MDDLTVVAALCNPALIDEANFPVNNTTTSLSTQARYPTRSIARCAPFATVSHEHVAQNIHSTLIVCPLPRELPRLAPSYNITARRALLGAAKHPQAADSDSLTERQQGPPLQDKHDQQAHG